MKSPKSVSDKFKQTLSTISRLDERLDEIKLNQGRLLSTLYGARTSTNIKDYEFKVFSQWGEDGIIQHLSKSIEIENRSFIEFGVENFFESNCRFLLMKDNWSGFVIDGSSANIATLKRAPFYWKYHLEALGAFVTKDNVNELLSKSGFAEDLGILSVDIDGNDYFVLEAITTFSPRILICEYNAVFGAKRRISVPYDPEFVRTKKHYSNLYYGASLAAITYLAGRKGYSLVGTNSVSVNAFYVRNDLLNGKVEVLSAEQAYFPSKFREGRDEKGNLSYLSGDDRLALIKGLPVVNVETNAIELL